MPTAGHGPLECLLAQNAEERLTEAHAWLICSALERAGLVQEDLCLMKEDARGALRLVAGSVAFPMRWSLLQKMGRRWAGVTHSRSCPVTAQLLP